MKVLVTGGAGFIGSHIVDQLLLRGHEVLVMDDMSSGRKENLSGEYPQLSHWMPGSITYRSEPFHDHPTRTAIDVAAQSFQPDVVCHQAAQPSLRRSIDDPAHDATVNIIGTLNVIAAAKSCGAHIVFASTSAVYATTGAAYAWHPAFVSEVTDTVMMRYGPLSEDSPLGPTTPYGLAKLTAERYIEMLSPSHTILRYGNVYGPRQRQVGENQLIPHCLAYLLDGKPFTIHGDGQQTRDFVYVGDIARANVQAIEGKVQGVFNAGTGKGTSVNEVCGQLRVLVDIDRPVMYGPAKAGEARHVALDSTRAKQQLGWEAETRLAAGLRETVAWWKEQHG